MKELDILSLQLLSIKDVSELLGLSHTTIHRWINSGKLAVYKLGGSYRIDSKTLSQFLINNAISVKPLKAKKYQRTAPAIKRRGIDYD